MAVKRLHRSLLILGLLSVFTALAADIDVIQLRYRSAAELLPLITPHLSSAATATGRADKIVLRADQAELVAVRRLIVELDTPPRSVLVTVRRGGSSGAAAGGFSAGGSTSGGRVRIHRSESAHSGSSEQQIRGLEGRPLHILARTLLPVTDRILWLGSDGVAGMEQTRLLELDGGFYALPRLHGDRVEIDILLQERGKHDPLSSRRVVTTVSGRIGDWIPFAATDSTERRGDSGLIYRNDAARRQADRLWLQVVPLD